LISFRFHLVSIVAVFLALALGVLVGTTVVNQGVIDDLERRADDAVQRSEELRDQVEGLQADLRTWEAFGASVEPLLVEGQLVGRQVLVVTQEDVDPGELDGVLRALRESGAASAPVLVVTGRMALADEPGRTELAAALGVGATDPSALAGEAARQLAARIAAGPGASEPDLLERLVAAGFLALPGGASPEAVGGPSQAVVVLSGGPGEPAVDPALFLAPLTVSLVHALRPVVAAETEDSAYPFVPLLRADDSLDGRVVTVDNADTMPGRIAVVLGLRDLLRDPGLGGHYGVKGGATALIPEP
jgi:hypothetical protein